METEVLNSFDMLATVVRTTLIFLYAFLLLRLLGKRHLSHLMYTDVMVIIAFGSAVGDVMIYGEDIVHLYTSMVAITVVAVIVKLLEELSSHVPRAGILIEGTARLLINNGRVVKEGLERENMSTDMLNSHLRQKNVETIQEVRKAFIEPDGELSLILYKAPPKKKK